jgi:DNA-binding NarL/FixJ family response regulator
MVRAAAPVKVFLAEDSVPIRERVAQMLRNQGIEVVGHAQSPQAAVAGILASQPDVVVLDIQLEGGTGLDVMRGVRSTAPQIAFIVLSNNTGPAYRKLYRMEGALHFLDKSADFEQLAQCVKDVAQAVAKLTKDATQTGAP